MPKEKIHDIFNKIKNDETFAIEELYKEYGSLIYGIAYSLVKNKEASEDIAQNVYLKIVKMDKKLLPNNFEMSWLYSVTKNETMNYIKKNRTEINIEDIYEISKEDEEIEEIIDKDAYNKIITGLDERDKEIVSLKILGDRKFREISELLDLPIGTVQWRYYRALHTIKILIGNIAMFVSAMTLYLLHNLKKKRKISNQMQKEDNNAMGSEATIEHEQSMNQETPSESKSEEIKNENKDEIRSEIEDNEGNSNNAIEKENDNENENDNDNDNDNIIEGNIINSLGETIDENQNQILVEAEIIEKKQIDYISMGLLSFAGIILIISIILGIKEKRIRK